jgi:transglutaminase-like putative cysteine protease
MAEQQDGPMTEIDERGRIDEAGIDWDRARCVTIEVRQSLRYEYPGLIEDLHQVLTMIPPDEAHDQRLLFYQLRTNPPAFPHYRTDFYGNRLCQIALSAVAGLLEFEVTLRVERRRSRGSAPARPDEERIFALPSRLTEPSAELCAAAEEIAAAGGGQVALVEAANAWVHRRLVYTRAVTDTQTRAADAVALGAGVCQDYAHVMLAICRQLGFAARYVSGHLLGQGAMHAWTQVLLPAGDGADSALRWQAFDPTHGCKVGLPYVTVAVGRDYGDVSPTRGVFRAPYAGRLADSGKWARVLAVA